MSSDCMLTTIDNPYDPFEQFTLWWQFDVDNGYNSSGRLMRIAKVTDDMSQEEYDAEIERAIDCLIEIDFTNTFKKVTKQTTTS